MKLTSISAGATSIIRCIKIPLLQSNDFTFRSGELAIWTVAEIATTIMATSIPVLRVFLRKMVTAHPTGANNPYHRSAADGTFLQSLRSASKGTEHTTTITSGARNSVGAKAHGRQGKDPRALSLAQGTGYEGKIMKIDTVAIDYGQRAYGDEGKASMSADAASNSRSSIELNAMPEVKEKRFRGQRQASC